MSQAVAHPNIVYTYMVDAQPICAPTDTARQSSASSGSGSSKKGGMQPQAAATLMVRACLMFIMCWHACVRVYMRGRTSCWWDNST